MYVQADNNGRGRADLPAISMPPNVASGIAPASCIYHLPAFRAHSQVAH